MNTGPDKCPFCASDLIGEREPACCTGKGCIIAGYPLPRVVWKKLGEPHALPPAVQEALEWHAWTKEVALVWDYYLKCQSSGWMTHGRDKELIESFNYAQHKRHEALDTALAKLDQGGA